MRTHTISGRGRIWHNGKLALEAAGYTITCRAGDGESGDSEHDPTETKSRPLFGQLSCTFPGWLQGCPIDLELEDGRRWHCRLQTNDGAIVDCGGLYRASDWGNVTSP